MERAMKRIKGFKTSGAILLLEEAVHLLRRKPAMLLPSYYIGSLPFILALLYFWADMSRSANASAYSAVTSLGLALLFVWMKCWHRIFATRIQTYLGGAPQQFWSVRRIFSLAATQTLIQSTGLIVLPLAGILLFPFGWCYAFYQNATVLVDNRHQGVSTLGKFAWQQAKLWPLQNHFLIGIFSLFGLVVFLNTAIGMLLFPYLIKKFLGIETLFTISGVHFFNTTFIAVALSITYLCMDPLIKTAYALRCLYGTALKTGNDLKTEFNQILQNRRGLVGGLLLLIIFATPSIMSAAQSPLAVSPETLDRSIDEVIERKEFAWRMPRETLQGDEQQTDGPFAAAAKWIIRKLAGGVKMMVKWFEKIVQWIIDLLPLPDPDTSPSGKNWIKSVRAVIIFLLIFLMGVLLFVLLQSWLKRRSSRLDILSDVVNASPDLEDEGLLADDLPTNQWLELAKELTEKGDLRLALRAFYLAILANLADFDFIKIEIYKSNRDYENELLRKAYDRSDLLSVFSKGKEIFERVWYGMQTLSRHELDQYAAIQKRVMTLAES